MVCDTSCVQWLSDMYTLYIWIHCSCMLYIRLETRYWMWMVRVS